MEQGGGRCGSRQTIGAVKNFQISTMILIAVAMVTIHTVNAGFSEHQLVADKSSGFTGI